MRMGLIRVTCLGFSSPAQEGRYLQYLDQQTSTWLFRLLAIFAAGTLAHVLRDRSLLSDACAVIPLATTALQLILWPSLQLHKRTSRLATVFLVPTLFRLYYVLAFLNLIPWTPLAHKLVSRGRTVNTGVVSLGTPSNPPYLHIKMHTLCAFPHPLCSSS